MKWEKKGLIYRNEGLSDWRFSSALQPTPLVLDDRIRMYVGFRDISGVSRVGFIDLDKKNPREIIMVSDNPVLDIGADGAFDEFGVVPSAVISVENKIYMYYAGYQLGRKVRFIVLSGLAVSNDGGSTFVRVKKTPVFERTDDELLFRVPHSVINENGVFKFWYGGGSHFSEGKNKTLPVYNVRYLESKDGISIPDCGEVIIDIAENEYRIGRPYVVKGGCGYTMFYGYSSEEKPYQLGCAYSRDGKSWVRNDKNIGISLSSTGWDCEMMAYPSVITINNRVYLFYNGNNYGADGFGYAELVEGRF